MFGAGKPNYEKLATNLKLAISRLKLIERKNTEMAIKARREIADYIASGKLERARIKVEQIIRKDLTVEAMEIVELYCDLILTRIGYLKTTKNLEQDIESPVANIIWAAPRLCSEIRELKVVSSELAKKYGKVFKEACRSDLFGTINKSLIQKLDVSPPPRRLIEKYMEEIAKSYNVTYTPSANRVKNNESYANNNINYGGGTVNHNGGLAILNEENISKSTKRLSLPVEGVSYYPSRQLSDPGNCGKVSNNPSFFNLPNVPSDFPSKTSKDKRSSNVIGFEQLEKRLKDLRTSPLQSN